MKFLLLLALGWALYRFTQAVMWFLGWRKEGQQSAPPPPDTSRKRVNADNAEEAEFEEIK